MPYREHVTDMPAEELTPEEGRALFDRRCREELRMSGEAFLAAWDFGVPPLGNPQAVERIVMLLPFAR